MARRFHSNKANVSRVMRGIRRAPWDEFVLPLLAVTAERRGHPVSERELRELKLLHERALVARDCHARGIVLLREELTELRTEVVTSHTRRRQWTALSSAALFVVVLGYSYTAMGELAKGTTSVHGDAPQVRTECVALPAGATEFSAACAKTQWRWSVPAGEGVKATFTLRTRHDIGELGGVLRLDSSCRAAASWSVTVRVPGTGTSELAAGTLGGASAVRLYAPLHRDARTLTFTARRTDGTHCAATVVWDRPRPAINY
ncbi:hypothetical protein ACH4L5_36465 [Streptomyces sp. NPDC017405]|uniref:hypothetical protein n=1 Tax=unclassified Streptomyces TaxID=2593676 RepID=UPI00378DC923